MHPGTVIIGMAIKNIQEVKLTTKDDSMEGKFINKHVLIFQGLSKKCNLKVKKVHLQKKKKTPSECYKLLDNPV